MGGSTLDGGDVPPEDGNGSLGPCLCVAGSRASTAFTRHQRVDDSSSLLVRLRVAAHRVLGPGSSEDGGRVGSLPQATRTDLRRSSAQLPKARNGDPGG